MRVLIASSEFPPGPGGIGTHAYELARQLHLLGWESLVVTAQDYASENEIATFTRSQPFPIVRFRSLPGTPLKALDRWRTLALGCRRWQPDVLVATGERIAWLMSLVARGKPWIAIGHGTEFGAPASWIGKLTRYAFMQATAIVCVSEHTRGQMLRAGIRPRLDHVIPNGADDARFRVLPDAEMARARSRLGLNGRRVLVTVGHVSHRKGQEVVIRALPEILARVPHTVYLMIGYPTEKQPLLALAEELGIREHVRFTGVVEPEQVVTYMNCADVFVMTSRLTHDGDFEGYGIAVVEAALCGKPAVVAGDSGLTEAITEGETGFSVPQNDPATTARAILELLESAALRSRMGEAARDRALAEQTWDKRITSYDRILRQVAEL